MLTSNRAIEAAEQRVEAERAESIRRSQQALRGHGRMDCADCGEPIDSERRKALPAAERCFDCQERRESRTRRRA